MNERAFAVGVDLKKAIIKKKMGDMDAAQMKIQNLAYKIKEAGKRNGNDLCAVYLEACLNYGISSDGDVVEKILTGQSQEIGIMLATGIMSEN